MVETDELCDKMEELPAEDVPWMKGALWTEDVVVVEGLCEIDETKELCRVMEELPDEGVP